MSGIEFLIMAGLGIASLGLIAIAGEYRIGAQTRRDGRNLNPNPSPFRRAGWAREDRKLRRLNP